MEFERSDLTERGRTLRRYFKSSSAGDSGMAGKLLALGLALTITGISIFLVLGDLGGCWRIFAFSGLVFVIPGLAMRFARGRRPSPEAIRRREELGALLQEDLARLRRGAFAALGIVDEEELEAEIHLLVSPIVWPTGGVDDEYRLSCSGPDGESIFGAYSAAVLALMEEKLGIYQVTLNFISGQLVVSQTREFRYRDIVSVSTVEQSAPGSSTPSAERGKVRELRLAAANGDLIRIVVDVPGLWHTRDAGALPVDEADRVVRAIRAMMRS